MRLYRAQGTKAASEDSGNAIITIKTDGHTITIDNFDFSNLEKASDGHGGTIIFDPPASANTNPASVSIGGVGNDTFVFHPGEGSRQAVKPWNLSLRSLGTPGARRFIARRHPLLRLAARKLQSLVKSLQPGAVVVVTRLDRLARSTIDLLTTIKQIADKGCLFKSLAEPWADTTSPAGRLMLTVLGGLAEFERELIKIRTSEGRERAKRAGVKMGRKPILSAHQITEIRSRKANGESVRFPRKIMPGFAKYDFEG